jgi:glycosyltransferase involved in cell wall biosynthesis
MFYAVLYRVNLSKNDYVIVQQQWIRDVFVKEYGCRPGRVVVAYPSARAGNSQWAPARHAGESATIIYPAYPRSFKNVEVVLAAMRRLTDVPLRLVLTLDGTENRYAARLRKRFGDLGGVTWAGFLPHDRLMELFSSVDAMVFPSKLESWGLPLSEFRLSGKPIFAADLPYARENLSGYTRASFFNPDDADALSERIRAFVMRNEFEAMPTPAAPAPPFARNWHELLTILDLETGAHA